MDMRVDQAREDEAAFADRLGIIDGDSANFDDPIAVDDDGLVPVPVGTRVDDGDVGEDEAGLRRRRQRRRPQRLSDHQQACPGGC